jgi:dihydrofolate reductase
MWINGLSIFMARLSLVEDNTLISIIVAFDKNRLIGKEGKIPWNIPEDLKNFRSQTMGHPIIMGRVTYDSLPKKPLKGRLNIVVSRTKREPEIIQVGDQSQIVYFQPNLEEAVKFAKMCCPNNDEIFIIGGKQIYEAALTAGIVDKIYATHVDGDYDGDTYLTGIPMEFNEIAKRECSGFQYCEYAKTPCMVCP